VCGPFFFVGLRSFGPFGALILGRGEHVQPERGMLRQPGATTRDWAVGLPEEVVLRGRRKSHELSRRPSWMEPVPTATGEIPMAEGLPHWLIHPWLRGPLESPSWGAASILYGRVPSRLDGEGL
jgi:hypothetical protein